MRFYVITLLYSKRNTLVEQLAWHFDEHQHQLAAQHVCGTRGLERTLLSLLILAFEVALLPLIETLCRIHAYC